jgi:hypothetical protein
MMRADELSRKMFLAGCLGLPWLWIVHTLYFYNKVANAGEDDEEYDGGALVVVVPPPPPPTTADSAAAHGTTTTTTLPPVNSTSTSTSTSTALEAYEIYAAEKIWVFRSRNAALVVVTAWLAWIIFCQVLAVDLLPDFIYVRRPDQGEFTGW